MGKGREEVEEKAAFVQNRACPDAKQKVCVEGERGLWAEGKK